MPHHRTSGSLSSSSALSGRASRESSPEPARKPFRFFELPSELRLRIYEEILFVPKPPIDLDPLNFSTILPRLSLFLVSRRMHEEAYRVFYSQTFRLYPQHQRFYHTKKPLLQRLPVRYRNAITSLALRLGPGWTAPPRCQNTSLALGLTDCVRLRTLHVFVELEPSDVTFDGFRGANATRDTYTRFCVALLAGILDQVPSLELVEIDAFPSVQKHAPLVSALRATIAHRGRALAWGPERGWDQEEEEEEEPALHLTREAMAAMDVSTDAPRAVPVQA